MKAYRTHEISSELARMMTCECAEREYVRREDYDALLAVLRDVVETARPAFPRSPFANALARARNLL